MSVNYIAVTKIVWDAARKAYKKDRANRYALRSPWVLPALNIKVPCRFENEYLIVEPFGNQSIWTLLPHDGSACDGASLAPDSPKGVVEGALVHDVLYLSIPAMSKTWGWTETQTRLTADSVFSTVILRAGGKQWIARLYYGGVYHLGGAYRKIVKLLPVLVIVAACGGMAGCSGCRTPPDLSDPDDPYRPPVYEKTAQVPAPQTLAKSAHLLL